MLLTDSDIMLLKEVLRSLDCSDIQTDEKTSCGRAYVRPTRAESIIPRPRLRNILLRKLLGEYFADDSVDIGLCFQWMPTVIEVGIYNLSTSVPIYWAILSDESDEDFHSTLALLETKTKMWKQATSTVPVWGNACVVK